MTFYDRHGKHKTQFQHKGTKTPIINNAEQIVVLFHDKLLHFGTLKMQTSSVEIKSQKILSQFLFSVLEWK
jgi:hypothetical protein